MDMYNKHVSSIVKYAVPAWQSMITVENSSDIERVQRSALSIIFGPNSYEKNMRINKIQSLEARRLELSKKFAKKCQENPMFNDWFVRKDNIVNTRKFMTRILNNH